NSQAQAALIYAGIECQLDQTTYQVPDDGIKHFLDCDLWLFFSDRLVHSLPPIRPYILMVYDYLQRYVPILSEKDHQQLMNNVHAAECILVTTEFTKEDAI